MYICTYIKQSDCQMNTNVNTNMTPLTQNVSGMVGITELDIPLKCPSFNYIYSIQYVYIIHQNILTLTKYLAIKMIILNNVRSTAKDSKHT